MLFEEKYKLLNKEQKLAVDSIEEPVMVIAGPGTGKTAILTMRIANILKQTDTPPSGILALTFTEAGQKEMKRRLRDLIGSRADEVGIFTYHGFAASVISEFKDHFAHLSRTKQIDEIESDEIVRKILQNAKYRKLRPLGDPDLFLYSIIRTIGICKKEAWTPDIIRQFCNSEIERIQSDEDSISTRGATKGQLKAEAKKRIEKCERTLLFSEVYSEYESKKLEAKKIDYDDLIFELITALKTDELLLRLLQEKYLHILVDEHQDTNESQNLLIKTIADFFDVPNLFVVGDEKQGIFRFQGASVENFLKFQNTWKSMKVISLKDNYRSHQSILDASFSMIENNYTEDEHKNLRIKLNAGGKETPKPIDLIYGGNEDATDKYLVDEIKNLSKIEPNATIAVIVRRNKDVEKILSFFEKNSINASAERGVDIFSHPIGIIFFALIETLSDTTKLESLAKTISAGLWDLDFMMSMEIVRKIRSGKIDGLESDLPAYIQLQKDMGDLAPIQYIIHAAEVSGLALIAARNPLSTEVWRGIVALAKDITSQKSIQDPAELINALLSFKISAEQKSIKISLGIGNEKIRVMTAHGSKGLEFDHVFLPYVNEEVWLTKNHGSFFVLPEMKEDGDEIRDTRRLFYVAMTRARKHLSILVPLQEGLGRLLSPLGFISEIDQNLISQKDLPAIQANEQNTISIDVKRKKELTDYANRVISENGLSVTALNHFIRCPSEFLYKSILKIPEAPSGPSEKGNAMHEAMVKVWQLEVKSVENITDAIQESVKEYFIKSFLPTYEKESIIEELMADAPKIAIALMSHFALLGTVYTEHWVEMTYKEIRLHGKLDSMVEDADRILVFDYKTGKAKTENEVRGETKNSDGDYFRQLIFYKILLEGSSKFKGKQIIPSLIFLKPDEKDRCKTITLEIKKEDVIRVEKEIDHLIEDVKSGKILEDMCEDKDCEFCGLKKLLH